MNGNAMATFGQLQDTPSSLDGVPAETEWSLRAATCDLIRAAARLLRLPLACVVVRAGSEKTVLEVLLDECATFNAAPMRRL